RRGQDRRPLGAGLCVVRHGRDARRFPGGDREAQGGPRALRVAQAVHPLRHLFPPHHRQEAGDPRPPPRGFRRADETRRKIRPVIVLPMPPPNTSPAPQHELVLTRIINQPREKLYRCWTEPSLLPRWFCPKPWDVARAELDVRSGGNSYIV